MTLDDRDQLLVDELADLADVVGAGPEPSPPRTDTAGYSPLAAAASSVRTASTGTGERRTTRSVTLPSR